MPAQSKSRSSASIIPDAPTIPAPVSTTTPPALAKKTLAKQPTKSATKPPTTAPSPSPADEEVPLEKRNAKLYKIGMGLFALILTITISVFYMRTKISVVTTDEIELSPTPSPSAKIIATPTPKATILKRDEITLEILNGTSTSGLAGKTATVFEELGYKIEKTGNADDIKENKLYVKAEFADQLSNLLEDVKSELEIVEITEEIDDLSTTARIILGGE